MPLTNYLSDNYSMPARVERKVDTRLCPSLGEKPDTFLG